MGLFNSKKKKNQPVVSFKWEGTQVTQDDNWEHVTKINELPFGWVSRNKEFTDRIQNEYSYFLNLYVESRTKSPRERYSALKSFVLYLEDVEKLCKSKGEYFEIWFHNILTSPDYIQKRKNELENLVANMNSLQEEYELKSWKEEEKQKKIIEMKPKVVMLLKANDGILQSDFWKLFDDEISRMAATDIVYALIREGQIERIKSGRSFILRYKGR